MSEQDLAYVDNIVEDLVSDFCPFTIKSCVVPEIEYIYQTNFGEKRSSISTVEWKLLPDVEEGAWGSCAFIGLADTLLRRRRGSEIDNHDVVIRLGELPIKKFKDYVGTRTDAIWIRRSAKMAPRGTVSSDHNQRRLYIGHNNGNFEIPVLKIFAHNKLLNGTHKHIKDKDRVAKSLYKRFRVSKWSKGTRKERVPSSGFKDVLLLISSKFCQRLDLYGFSHNCGGAYHNVRHIMQLTHNCELESWFLHYIMLNFPELGVCVNI